MQRLLSLLALCAGTFIFQAEAQAQAAAKDMGSSTRPAPDDDSIYKSFGEKAGIRALMEDFFVRLQADERTKPFFAKADRENLVSQLTDQLCYESGGPCIYRGAPMKGVHRGLEIDKHDFNALVEVLQQAMEAKGIAFQAQNRLLARLAPMHREIITR